MLCCFDVWSNEMIAKIRIDSTRDRISPYLGWIIELSK